ncbi:MAG: hypothetical protein E7589_02065 [Ruminococcaceae bacterium]|nr:hypothetical protein [Oscillospiraceae bacterium]
MNSHDGPRGYNHHSTDREYSAELCDERHDRLDFDIRHVEEKLEKLEICTVKLTDMIERHDKMIDAQQEKLGAIEKAPITRLQKLLWYAVSAVAGALAVALTDYIAL